MGRFRAAAGRGRIAACPFLTQSRHWRDAQRPVPELTPIQRTVCYFEPA
jgi:hypothetical protein